MAGETYPPENEIPESPNEFGEPRKEALTLGARLLFIIVAVVGVGSLAWGVWRFGISIKKPFLAQGGNNAVAENDINKLIDSQNKDTDGDGLSDYDELYVYKTSPYLKDSDSDGYDDKTEIKSGYDPNCPAGQNCGLPATGNTSSTPEQATPNNSALNSNTSLTPAQIREALIKAGMSKEELDQINDQTLLQLYQEVLAEQAASGDALSNTNSGQSSTNTNNTPTQDLASLKNLSAAQIRELLIKQGADETQLKQIDDATLIKNWQEIIAEEEASATGGNK